MASFPEIFDEDGSERRTLDSERPLASTPLVRAEGHRWAELDGVDLDPPASFPPHPADA